MAEAAVHGIDVSHYQGSIDWGAVAKSGIDFAFIKATDGAGAGDPMFASNWKGARDAGIRRGAYHFFRPLIGALQQAQRFISKLGGDWGELAPVLDFEILDGASANAALDAARRWMETVEEACGRKPILYTGPALWTSSLHDSQLFAEHPLWIAQYTSAPQPRVPKAWKEWTFWQHSEKRAVPGISGPVDLNRFHGTLMELDALCARISIKSATAGSWRQDQVRAER
jgi:lysozyme